MPRGRLARLLAFLVAALAATLVLAPSSTTSAPTGGLLVPGKSLGGVALGMTKAEVLHVWGKRHGVCRGCRRTTWYFNYRSFEPQGAGVVFERGRVAHVFTVWEPDGWRTLDGLALGADAGEIRRFHPIIGERACAGYTALLSPAGRAESVFYVYRDEVWGFGLTRRAADPCL